MVNVGRARVWVRVGYARIRADKITAVTRSDGSLHLDVTGHPGGLTLPLPSGAERTDRRGEPVDWADELLRVIEQATALPVGTLITFTDVNNVRAAGFTARALTGDDRILIEPPVHPVPDIMPPRPIPDSWARPIPSAGRKPGPHTPR
ncbi:hypothetical protein [Streptomyces sp. NPDC051546]|uniref:hypothetical protein n=1 Tax=Streptomyces sp. NPDC051546 TaxID=3365655 RepID=UPI0037935ABD